MPVSLHPFRFFLASGILATALLSISDRSATAEELMSPAAAGRVGMVEAWRRQLSLVGGAQSAVDIQLYVDGSRKRTFIEVSREADGQTEVLNRIDVNQLDSLGKPIGLKEAQRLASLQVMRWKRRGIAATAKENEIHQVRIYTLGKDGTVEARDAETGELIWLSRNGDPMLPNGSLGINDEFVTFTNGSILYQLSAESGKTVREVRLAGTPLLGSELVGNYALVPTTSGGIEGFPMFETLDPPFVEMVAGRATNEPTPAPNSTRCAWPTDQDFVYVMETEGEPSVLFRFPTDGVVSARVAATVDDRFFFGTEHGHVYGIQATRSGDVLWRLSIGQPIYSPVFTAGDRLLLASAYKNLFSIETATGTLQWASPVSQIDQVVSASENNIYARTSGYRLTVIDAQSGSRTSDLSNISMDHIVVNRLTDRLYLLSTSGMLQCLRPVNASLPQLRVIPAPPVKVEDKDTDTPKKPEPPKGNDPFAPAGGADPFAPAGGADPFAPAGGVDPFAPAGGADPFAPANAGNDPFAAP